MGANGSVVGCLTRGQSVACLSLSGGTVLCPSAKYETAR